jgi:hypothetical protein
MISALSRSEAEGVRERTVHLMNPNPVPLARENLLPSVRQLQLPRPDLPPLRAPLTHAAIRSRDDLVAEADAEELETRVDFVERADEGDEGVDPGEVVVGIGGCVRTIVSVGRY